MTTPDLERRLTDVLRRQAEEAMSRTDTNAERQRFQTRISPQSTAGTPRWVVAVAAALTAAAMALGTIWYSDLVTAPDSGPVRPDRPTQTADERVAQRFAEAYFGDVRRAASFLAESVAAPPGWRDMTFMRAWSVTVDVHACQTTSVTDYGTFVDCPFDYHSLRSEQLGLGPWGTSTLTATVRDREVRSFREVSSDEGRNGSEVQLFEDFSAWIRENHPEELAFLHKRGTPVEPVGDKSDFVQSLPPAEMERWIRLWQERTAEYVEEMTGG